MNNTKQTMKGKKMETITVEEVRKLASTRKDLLEIDVTSITPEVAKEIMKFKGKYLILDYIKVLDKESAKELAKFEGDLLHLESLEYLSNETIRELRKFKGKLPFFSNESQNI